MEFVLFRCETVWIYQVPKAQKNDKAAIQLFEPTKKDSEGNDYETLFAQCPLEITRDLPLDIYIQDCVDSSRYFMLRVEDEASKRRAYIGVGFPERATAFNFKAALQDYVKSCLRQLEVESRQTAEEDDKPMEPSNKYTLPEGATIRVNVNKSGRTSERKAKSSESTDGNFFLPPPPANNTDDDEWGDFASA